jgi:hypothetical protein
LLWSVVEVCSPNRRLHFTRAQLREVMRLSGLAFVADGMEPRERFGDAFPPDEEPRA